MRVIEPESSECTYCALNVDSDSDRYVVIIDPPRKNPKSYV
jgi:hypothetical protein